MPFHDCPSEKEQLKKPCERDLDDIGSRRQIWGKYCTEGNSSRVVKGAQREWANRGLIHWGWFWESKKSVKTEKKELGTEKKNQKSGGEQRRKIYRRNPRQRRKWGLVGKGRTAIKKGKGKGGNEELPMFPLTRPQQGPEIKRE